MGVGVPVMVGLEEVQMAVADQVGRTAAAAASKDHGPAWLVGEMGPVVPGGVFVVDSLGEAVVALGAVGTTAVATLAAAMQGVAAVTKVG